MSTPLRLDDVRLAWEARDPELVRPRRRAWPGRTTTEPETPVREGAPTFAKFLAEIREQAVPRKPRDEQAHYPQSSSSRRSRPPTPRSPLPDRLRLHEIIDELWADDGPFARSCLLAIIAQVPLRYGPWRALKRIFKEAEARGDTEVFGALAARFDADVRQRRLRGQPRRRSPTSAAAPGGSCGGRRERLPGLLRRLAVRRARPLPEGTRAGRGPGSPTTSSTTRAGDYDRDDFGSTAGDRSADLLKHRAFADLWKRSPRPLFGLLERARSDRVREFAADGLEGRLPRLAPRGRAGVGGPAGRRGERADRRVRRLDPQQRPAVRAGGLPLARPARRGAAAVRLPVARGPRLRRRYARTHARDLPVDDWSGWPTTTMPAVRRLAADLLQATRPAQGGRPGGLGPAPRIAARARAGRDGAPQALRRPRADARVVQATASSRRAQAAFEFARTCSRRSIPSEKLGPDFFAGLIEAARRPSARRHLAQRRPVRAGRAAASST